VFGRISARVARTRGAAKGAAPTGGPPAATPTLSRLGAGRPLSPALSSRMTGALGGDFSGVRLHTDPPAARAAESVSARAFTVGQHVYFGSGSYQPGAPAGDRLLAHELVHTMQQGNAVPAPGTNLTVSLPGDREEVEAHRLADLATGPDVGARTAVSPVGPRVQRSPRVGSVGPRIARWGEASGQTEPAPVHTGPGWQVMNKPGVVGADKPNATLPGARLRPVPDTEGPQKNDYVLLTEGTHVHVVSTKSEAGENGWRYVIVTEGDHVGRVGYSSERLIKVDLPDPQAVEYYIATPDLGLQWLVEHHKHFEGYNITTGDDARSLAMAVYMANKEAGRKGVYLNEDKLSKAQNPSWWEGTKDRFDEYRRVLRPIFQSVELQLGRKIWLPGPAYVDRLKDLSIIPTRAAWKNDLIKFGKAAAGFVSGLVQGFAGSIIDLVVGIWDLLKTIFNTVRDLFSGELVRKGKEVYAALKAYMDEKDAGEILSDFVNAITSAAGEMWSGFVNKWTADNLFDAWNFRGRVIGYLAAEILMAVFSGGSTLAAKLLSKLGKFGKILEKILATILKKIDDVLDAVPARKRFKKEGGKHGDGKDSKGKELPFAIASAAVIAESNDKLDTPIPFLKAQLWVLEKKYKWITDFRAERRGPGKFQIVMIGSHHVVDPEYTTKVDEPGDAPGTSAPQKQGVNPPPREGVNVPESGRQFEKRVAQVEPPSKNYFGFMGGDRKNFKTLVKEVKAYEKNFKSGLKLRNSGVLGESAREVVQRNRRLRGLWEKAQKPITDEIERLQKAMREVRGDPRTMRDLRGKMKAQQDKLEEMNDFANGLVGNKRPDMVEFHPDQRLFEVTDITQKIDDPWHNFKTEFYGVVVQRLTGYSKRAGDWRAPTVARPLSKGRK